MTQYPQDPQQPYQGQPYGQQQPPGWQPPPPPKKKHTVRNVILVLLGLGILGLVGCVAIVANVGNEIDKQSNAVHTVVYKVSGSSQAASLTYTTDGSGSTEQVADAALPWTKTVQVKGLVLTYQVLAQNSAPGTVTCSIEVDGKVVKTATANGQSSIAHCTATQ